MIKRPDGSYESYDDRNKREREAKDNERMAAMERAIKRKKLMAEAGEVSPEEAADFYRKGRERSKGVNPFAQNDLKAFRNRSALAAAYNAKAPVLRDP